LEKIAGKLDEKGGYIFEKLVKQQKINAITTIIQNIYCSLFIIPFIVVFFILKGYGVFDFTTTISNDGWGLKTFLFVIYLCGLIIYLISLFQTIFWSIDSVIKDLKNPEGQAIEKIIENL